MPFYAKGDVRIRYEEAGSGFPLLVTPGGGLNSRVSNWAPGIDAKGDPQQLRQRVGCPSKSARSVGGNARRGARRSNKPGGRRSTNAVERTGVKTLRGLPRPPVRDHGLRSRSGRR
jgi:hypothetical protein